MRRTIRTALVGTMALTLAMLAGCMKEDKGATPGANPSVDKASVKCGAGTGQKATGTPVKVGAITTASGGIDFSSSPVAARAYFDCVNANGGIDGRPIEYQVEDDGLNPQKASQLATKLAGDQGVVALVGGSSFVACGVSGPIWAQNGLYDLLATGVPRSCFESPRIAPVNSGPRISAIAAAQYAVSVLGAKKLAQISNKTPGTGDWTQAGVRAWAAANGVQVVGDVLHDPGIKDANAVLLEAMRNKPDAILLEDPAPDDLAVLKAAQAQNLKGKVHFICLTPCYDVTFPAAAGSYWDGFVSNSEFAMLDSTEPDAVLWRQVMDAYASAKAPRDSFSQAGFLAAKIFVDTVLKAKPELTRAGVGKAIVGIKNYKSDLLCVPWYFAELDKHNANHTTRYVKIQGDKYVAAQGCTRSNDPDLAPILEAEKTQGLANG